VAQIFTLLHELSHIWRGDSGISGGLRQSSLSVETLCNRVAAEVLVPSSEFDQVWSVDEPIADAVRSASRHFRISRYVVAIKAFESGRISRGDLDELLEEYEGEGRRAPTSSGGDYYRTLVSRNGRAFTERVIGAVSRQDVLVRDAASLLDAKPGQLARIGQELGRAG
jgi:Zn-dependent peptidase ImmA (M78 family)